MPYQHAASTAIRAALLPSFPPSTGSATFGGTADMRGKLGFFITGSLIAMPVQAQQIGPFASTAHRPDARATIGITIPLGGRRGDVASEPRAELRIGPAAGSADAAVRPALRAIGLRGSETSPPAPGALAVTLGSEPRWMAGGRLLNADQDETPEDDDGIDTLEGIGIGIGVLAVATGVAFAALILPALDCDRDEECN